MSLTITHPHNVAHLFHILGISKAYLLLARYEGILQLFLLKLLLGCDTCLVPLCFNVFEEFRAGVERRDYRADRSDNLWTLFVVLSTYGYCIWVVQKRQGCTIPQPRTSCELFICAAYLARPRWLAGSITSTSWNTIRF